VGDIISVVKIFLIVPIIVVPKKFRGFGQVLSFREPSEFDHFRFGWIEVMNHFWIDHDQFRKPIGQMLDRGFRMQWFG